MISIIITTYKELSTIKKALTSFLETPPEEPYEILVVSPDLETKEAISDLLEKHPTISHLQDQGQGKPAALNLALANVQGEIVVLTDGDVITELGALDDLLKPFEDPLVGLVTGRPLSLESEDTMLGYWSSILTDIAHKTRERSSFVVASGYLYAFRKGLITPLPEDALSEDAVISSLVFEQGYKTVYAREARVYVRYPKTLKDWIKQKKRSAGGYTQLSQYVQGKERMRSFTKEASGVYKLLPYCTTLKKALWIFCLIFTRLYLWILILFDVKLKRKSFKQLWVRVESTK